MKKHFLLLPICFLMIGFVIGQNRYVTTTGAGNQDGTSWNDAYSNTLLQTAINEPGVTEVWVAAGTYKPTVDVSGDPLPSDPRTKCFQLKNGVAIYGGFGGTEILRSERNLAVNVTILSGDIGTQGNNADNSYHVIYNDTVDNSAILDGFTIRDGKADGVDEQSGAGVCNVSSSPTLTNCTISGNYSVSDGGGVLNYIGSSPILSNCLITGNYAANGGGVCNFAYSHPIMNTSTISGNLASNGGGVYNHTASSLTVNNSIIWGNTAAIGGNQFCIDDVSTTLNYSCYANGSGDISGILTCNACIYLDPKFVNHLNDFRITGLSPCIDMGNNGYNSESTDIRGNTRIQIVGGDIDMGAYEYSFPSDPAEPQIIYVDASKTIGSFDGSSWDNAFTSLQDALDVALGNHEIWVADGTYTPTADSTGNNTPADERTKCFRMKNGVAIYGGFAGSETSLYDRDWKTNVAILSGDIGTAGVNNDNSYHVVYNSNLNRTAILDGFAIQKGEADNAFSEQSGAGVYNINSSPTLVNCTISENFAYGNGSGVFNANSSPDITNCTISGNNGNYGAGIYNTASNPVLTNCLIVNNIAMAPGGGVASEDLSSLTLTNCTLTGNTSMAYGGGIFNSTSSLTINNSIIWGNNSIGTGYQISIESGTVTMNYSCYANGSSDVVINTGGTFTPDANCITTEPLFVNPTSYDYRIYGNSPCADAGNDTYNYEITDTRGPGFGRKLFKTDAYTVGTIDMGAYEFNKRTDPYLYQVIYVDASKTSGLYDGTSWENAYTSLQTALTNAASYSEIWVAAGTYKPTAGSNRSISFNLKNDVLIYGGFAGTETMTNERNWASNVTILSGDIGTPVLNTDNSYHVVYNYQVNSAILDGFTIQGGNALGSAGYGGGVYNEVSSPTLANCIVSGNTAPVGAGVYNYNYASPTLTNCVISGNTATGNWGGGLYNYYHSSPTLTNCTLSGNTSTAYGGGMVNNYESSPNIYNSIIWGNTAATSGNQIYNFSSAAWLYFTCYANGTGDVFNASGTLNADANCITTAPLFVNAAGDDYRIGGNSPCVNTGNNGFNGETFDVRRQVRIQNATIDMGAYEWTSGIDPYNVITWTGAVSSDWNTGGNWNPAIIPTGSDEVIIPNVQTHFPVVNESPSLPAMCNDLTINAGAVLTIAQWKSIIVNGTITIK